MGYEKQKDMLLPLMKLYYRKYPNLVEAMVNRQSQYNATLDYIRNKEKAGEILVIRPPEKLPIGRTENDPEKLRQVYEIGRNAAESKIAQMQAFLASD